MGLITFTDQEFRFLQSYTNEMFQSATLRTGPMGDMIIALRTKFLNQGPVDLSDVETRFLLYALQDTYQTSHSPIVTSQLGNSMRFLGEDNPKKIVSSISQINTVASDESQGTYLTEWQIMQSCMTKLGLAPPSPYIQPAVGPTGDPGAISTGRPNVNPDDRMQ